MSFKSIIKKMKDRGIIFANGLTTEEFDKIEKIYNIKFPKDLKEFLSNGLPFAEYSSTPKVAGQKEVCHYEFSFPIWNDFSEENIAKIKDWIDMPKNSLIQEYEQTKKDEHQFYDILLNDLGLNNENSIEEIDKEFNDYVNNKLEKTIPIFAHRYILQKENSPILSIWESDDIALYGENLYEYLECEFFNKKVSTDYFKINLGNWYDVVLR